MSTRPICGACDRSFSRLDGLIYHIRKQSTEDPAHYALLPSCPRCHEKFPKSSRRHACRPSMSNTPVLSSNTSPSATASSNMQTESQPAPEVSAAEADSDENLSSNISSTSTYVTSTNLQQLRDFWHQNSTSLSMDEVILYLRFIFADCDVIFGANTSSIILKNLGCIFQGDAVIECEPRNDLWVQTDPPPTDSKSSQLHRSGDTQNEITSLPVQLHLISVSPPHADSCYTGLVSIPTIAQPVQLEDFFMHYFIPSRTLLRQNIYRDALQVSRSIKSSSVGISALSSFYLGKTNARALKDKAIHILQQEVGSNNQSSENITGYLYTALLLLQYTILSKDMSEWAGQVEGVRSLLRYAIQFSSTLPFRVKIASHAILSGASSTAQQQFSVVDFLSDSEKSDQRIDAMTGLSPELLQIIQDIGYLAFSQQNDMEAMALKFKSRLEALSQTCSADDLAPYIDMSAQNDALHNIHLTAESYRLATMLYLSYRVLGIPPTDVKLKSTQIMLLNTLGYLPRKGGLFKATWPLWSLFICSVQSPSSDYHTRIMSIWDELDNNSSRSNMPPVIAAVRAIHSKSSGNHEHQGWWWEQHIRNCGRLSLT